MPITVFLVTAALFVAYANGANDNFKGVATLYGSGTLGYKSALSWATGTTLAGSLCSVLLGNRLVMAFSAKGLIPDSLAAAPEFLAAVALGAALTIFLATQTGFPISTTHALTGSLVGAGIGSGGGSVNFTLLVKTFFFPLIASPFLAMALTGAAYPFFRWAFRCSGFNKNWCCSLGDRKQFLPVITSTAGHAQAAAVPLSFSANSSTKRFQVKQSRILGVNIASLLDVGHILSAGTMSFARGLNDAPKILGLILALKVFQVEANLFFVAAAMATGGLIHARKVAETVSQRITGMNRSQGFVANMITSLLVLTASHSGLPVSTTHVSCGSLFGIGIMTQQADSGVIRQVVLSWVLTLPIAALLAAAASWILD
jgi:PiT family inorganic phosphate transporter